MIHHRLFEAFLARLARYPDAEGFVLRGGMRVRQLAPSAGRRAVDVDLVCRLPYDIVAIQRRIEAVLADDSVADGVRFEPAAIQIEPGWRPVDPGLRILAAGQVCGMVERPSARVQPSGLGREKSEPERPSARVQPSGLGREKSEPERPSARVQLSGLGREKVSTSGLGRESSEPAQIAIDLRFGLTLWPPPSQTKGLWACQAETILARKLRIITQLGRRGWRPKDLADLALLTTYTHVDRAALGEAVEGIFDEGPVTRACAREVFGHPMWWSGRFAAARWASFAANAGYPAGDLEAVVASVRHHLAPVLGQGT